MSLIYETPENEASISDSENDPLCDEENDDIEVTVMASAFVNPHKDKYNFVYIVFLLLGMGGLLPYNMFINATEYFNYKLRDLKQNETDSDEPESELQKQFESYFTTFATATLLVMVFGNTVMVRYIGNATRLMASLVGVLVCFIPSLVLVKIDTNNWQSVFFALSILNIVFLNAMGATLQSGVIGVAGILDVKYTEAAMSGQAVAGVFSSLTQIFCLFWFDDPEDSAILYFSLAEVFMLILLISYIILLRHPYYIAANNHLVNKSIMSRSERNVQGSVYKETVLVFRKTFSIGSSLAFVFFVSLTVFPNFMTHIEPTVFNDGRYWDPVTVFLLFNLFDLAGRVLAGFIKLPSTTFSIVTCCLLRAFYLVIYLFCNYQSRHGLIPVWIENDYVILFLNISLAFSNGYLATICMIYGSRDVERVDLLEQAGTILTFFLSFGLSLGSLFSFVYIEIP